MLPLFWYTGRKDSNHLNTTCRWQVVQRRLDGAASIIYALDLLMIAECVDFSVAGEYKDCR